MRRIEFSDPGPEQQASSSQLREVTERKVSALPDSFRSVIVMRNA